MARGPYIIFIAKCPRGDQVRGGGGGLLWHTGAAREAPGQGAVKAVITLRFRAPICVRVLADFDACHGKWLTALWPQNGGTKKGNRRRVVRGLDVQTWQTWPSLSGFLVLQSVSVKFGLYFLNLYFLLKVIMIFTCTIVVYFASRKLSGKGAFSPVRWTWRRSKNDKKSSIVLNIKRVILSIFFFKYSQHRTRSLPQDNSQHFCSQQCQSALFCLKLYFPRFL